MRFLHTADLHIGRRLAQMSLEEDTQHLLDSLAVAATAHQVDALVIAGDVFDSPTTSEAALLQWENFVRTMAARGIPTLVVSGNHDSGTRLAYGAAFAADKGIHIAGDLRGEIRCVNVGGVNFWLIPFVRPADVRAWGQELGLDVSSVVSYDTALRLVLDHVRGMDQFLHGPNVCVAHQFVTNSGVSPDRSDSERLSLGTLDNVDVSAFQGFEYVALGHVHGPQRVGRDGVRYAGSPLKLSSSEIPQHKSFSLVTMGAVGQEPQVELVPVRPLHDFRSVRGSVDQLVAAARLEDEASREDYIRAVVTDDSAMDVVARLRDVWPNLEQVTFDNSITRAAGAHTAANEEVIGKDMGELFQDFFAEQAGRPLTEEERSLVVAAMERVRSKEADQV